MITLAQLKAFSRYMERELLHPDVAPVVRWVEELAANLDRSPATYPVEGQNERQTLMQFDPDRSPAVADDLQKD